ncbi:MAG: hypothetical protein LBG96_00160 [Tannerella sp.]|jgi:hypothetical protein|nr:hypothetical protein [Tannerella sp.]
MNDIIDLQETSSNRWLARYQGNYGLYTIKIAFDANGKASGFSCSCPSDYYPCKHIDIVKNAIAERIAKSKDSKKTKDKTLTIEELLQDVSLQELRDFVIRQAKYNDNLSKAIKLEFAGKITRANTNIYYAILREELKEVYFDYENYYENEEGLDLEVLDRWLDKARVYVEQNNPHEAVLICKACIEEFADWLQEADAEVFDYIDESYQSIPFDIIKTAVASSETDSKELYDYCLSEMKKDRYSGTTMSDEFNDLLATLAVKVNPDAFIALQDSLLRQLGDKNSREAEKILQRKIDFYNNAQQSEKANELIEKNIQIENFRYQVAEKRFAEQNFAEAKKLITDFLAGKTDHVHYYQRWSELLLKIAKKEHDIPLIRTIAFAFIARRFDKKYFVVYKSTFTPEEWKDALENILQHYAKNSRDYNSHDFNSSVADVLVLERSAERLMQYVEKNLSAERMSTYHSAFVNSFPEKTLELFRKAVDAFTANNLGRDNYEYVVKLLKQMKKIKDGDKTVADMVSRYKIEYKRRSAMMEILNRL